MIEGEQADRSALQQIKQQHYATKYDDGEHRIFLIGIEFSKLTRNIVGFSCERFEA